MPTNRQYVGWCHDWGAEGCGCQSASQRAAQSTFLEDYGDIRKPTLQSYISRTYWFFRNKRTVFVQTLPWDVRPIEDRADARVRIEHTEHTVTGDHVRVSLYDPPPFQKDVLDDGWTPMNLLSGLAGVAARLRSGLERGTQRLTTIQPVRERAQYTQYDAGDFRDHTEADDTRLARDLDALVVLRADAGVKGAVGEGVKSAGAGVGGQGGGGGVSAPLCDCIPLGDGDGYLRGPRCQVHADYISTQGAQEGGGGGAAGGEGGGAAGGARGRAAKLAAAKRAKGGKGRVGAVDAKGKGAGAKGRDALGGIKGREASGGAKEGQAKKNKAVGVRVKKKKVKATKQTVQTARPTPVKKAFAAVFQGVAFLRILRKFLTEESEPSSNYACYAKSQDPTGLVCWPCALPAAPCDCYTDHTGEQIRTCDLKNIDPLMAKLLDKKPKRKPNKKPTNIGGTKTQYHVQFSSEVMERTIPNEDKVYLNKDTPLFKTDKTWGQDVQVRAVTAGEAKAAVPRRPREDGMRPVARGIAGLVGPDGSVGVTRNQAARARPQPGEPPEPCDDRCHVCMPSEASSTKTKAKGKGAFATPLYGDAPGEVGAPIEECTCKPCPTEDAVKAARNKVKQLGAMGGGTSRARHGEGARGLAQAQAEAEAEGGGAGDELPEGGDAQAKTCAWKTGGVGAVCQPCREQNPCECTTSEGFEWKDGGCLEAEELKNNLRRKKKILLIKKKIVRRMFVKQLKENLEGNPVGKCVVCMIKKSSCLRRKKKRIVKRNKLFEKLEKERIKSQKRGKKAKADKMLLDTKERKKTQEYGAKSAESLEKHKKMKQKKSAKKYALEEKRRKAWRNRLKNKIVASYKTAMYVMSDDVERSDRRPLCRWLESTKSRVYDCRHCVDVCTCQRMNIGARVGPSCAKRVYEPAPEAGEGPPVDGWPHPRLPCGWADETITWPPNKARKCKVCEAASAVSKPRPCDCKVVKGKIIQGVLCSQKSPDEPYAYYRYPSGIPLDPMDQSSCLWTSKEKTGRMCVTCPLEWTEFKNEKYLMKLERDILEKLNDVEGKLKLKEEMYVDNIVKHLAKEHRIPCKYYSKKDAKTTFKCTACKGEETKKPEKTEKKPIQFEGYKPPCYWERKTKASAKCLVCDPEDEHNRKTAALNEYITKKGKIKRSKLKNPVRNIVPIDEKTVMLVDTLNIEKYNTSERASDRKTVKNKHNKHKLVDKDFNKRNYDVFALTAVEQSKTVNIESDDKTALNFSAIPNSQYNVAEDLLSKRASESESQIAENYYNQEENEMGNIARQYEPRRMDLEGLPKSINILPSISCCNTQLKKTAPQKCCRITSSETLLGSKYKSNSTVNRDCTRIQSKEYSSIIEFNNSTNTDVDLTKTQRRSEIGTDTTELRKLNIERKYDIRRMNFGDCEGNPCGFKNYLKPAKNILVTGVEDGMGGGAVRRAGGGHSLRTNG